jgi:hypothetical protein
MDLLDQAVAVGGDDSWISGVLSRIHRLRGHGILRGCQFPRLVPNHEHTMSASSPSDFNRIVSYGGIAMLQTMPLYVFSDAMERRMRNRAVDPSWRR